MRITSKGQVTIPIDVRRRFGLHPATEVEFEAKGGVLRIRKVTRCATRGRAVVDRLRGKGTVRLTTDQILALTRG